MNNGKDNLIELLVECESLLMHIQYSSKTPDIIDDEIVLLYSCPICKKSIYHDKSCKLRKLLVDLHASGFQDGNYYPDAAF